MTWREELRDYTKRDPISFGMALIFLVPTMPLLIPILGVAWLVGKLAGRVLR